MRRLLFVDDEPHILDGLRNVLHKERRRWAMAFASSGPAALAELERSDVDVIVSDLRMPGMDGAALLAEVKRRHPAVVRIVLSGNASQDAALASLAVAHQFLDKPCDAATLRAVIERACGVRALLANEPLRRLVGRLDHLPPVPRTYELLTRELAKPDASAADVAAVLERDPALSVKLLQIVNSAYFGLAQRIASVQKAIAYLGVELLKALVLTSDVFAPERAPAVSRVRLEELQSHSLATATAARRIVRDRRAADEAFTAALLHDVGKIVLALSLPAELERIDATVRATGRPVHAVERELLEVTHAEIGAYLLGVWGLPLSIVEATLHHHTPEAAPPAVLDLVAAIHAADVLAHEGEPA